MNSGIYQAAYAMTDMEKRMTGIAENLSNVSTPGFKRQHQVPADFGEELKGKTAEKKPELVSQTDYTQGDLERTGMPSDLALFGEGFFALEGPEGEMFTRNGTFTVNEEGVLINNDGYPVAWEERPTNIDAVGEAPLEINSQGEVFQGIERLGKLRIVDFEDKQLLSPTTHGYLEAPQDAIEIPSTAAVHQGALESSNAVGMNEIIGMIEVQRSFEQMARLVTTINESYSRLTRSF
jgi:flagellar basal-body rod protein FlgF